MENKFTRKKLVLDIECHELDEHTTSYILSSYDLGCAEGFEDIDEFIIVCRQILADLVKIDRAKWQELLEAKFGIEGSND